MGDRTDVTVEEGFVPTEATIGRHVVRVEVYSGDLDAAEALASVAPGDLGTLLAELAENSRDLAVG